MAKNQSAQSGKLSVVPTPLDEAIARLQTAYPALLGFELLLDHITEEFEDGEVNGQVLSALIKPHVMEIAAALDELLAARRLVQ